MKMKEEETTSNEVKQEEKKKTKKCAKITKFRKAPQAPKRFKSAFIFFSVEKHPEIRKRLEANEDSDVPNVAKLVSEEWRNLSPEDRAVWEKKAADDKRRYELERTMYTGPWKIPASKRAKKDPDAPKRPMSAFLAFSKKMRSQVKQENLHLSNTEVSKLLATKWKEASDEERNIHIKREAEERGAYKIAISKWRLDQEEKLETQRKQREKIAQMAIANGVGTLGHGVPPNGQVGYPQGGYGYGAPGTDMGGTNMGTVPPPYSNMPYDGSRYPIHNHHPEENYGVGNEYYGTHESPHSASHYNDNRHRSQPPYSSNENQAPFISNAPPESQGYYNNNDGYAGNHQHPIHPYSNDAPTYAAKDQRMMPDKSAQPPNAPSWGYSNSNDRFISEEQRHPRSTYVAPAEQQYYNNIDKYPQQQQSKMAQNVDNYPQHENYHNDRHDGQYYTQGTQGYYQYS